MERVAPNISARAFCLRIKFQKLLDCLVEEERLPFDKCKERTAKSSGCNFEIVISLKLKLLTSLDVIIQVLSELECNIQLLNGQGPHGGKYDMQHKPCSKSTVCRS